MRKRTNFGRYEHKGWPDPEALKPYFFGPPGKEWFNTGGSDSAGLTVEGLHGTANEDHLAGKRVDVDLYLDGTPGLGVLLFYHKHGGSYREGFSSKGDMGRLREWVRNLHGDLRPVGLYIPFPRAFDAVKEFIETDGQLPKCIEWVADEELPPGTYPDPAEEWERRHAEQQRLQLD